MAFGSAVAWASGKSLRQHVIEGCDFFSRHPFMRRILAGFVIRPWLTDIGCAVAAIQWGFWVEIHAESVALTSGFARFRDVMPELAFAAFAAGVIQLFVALMKMPRSRQAIALFKVTLWLGLSMGVTTASGAASYFGWAILDGLIVARAF